MTSARPSCTSRYCHRDPHPDPNPNHPGSTNHPGSDPGRNVAFHRRVNANARAAPRLTGSARRVRAPQVSATERCALKISMGSIGTMEDLQELVAEVCEEAGYRQLEDLVMAYKRPDGEFATVTRSVTIEMLRESPALRLAPKAAKAAGASKSKSSSKGGKSKR